MSKPPFHFFWRPLNFEVTRKDLRTVPDSLVRLYLEVLEAYWQADCDLAYDELKDGLNGKSKDLDMLFSRVKGLSVIDGKVHHEHTLNEFVRAAKKSGNASAAAIARWGVPDDSP